MLHSQKSSSADLDLSTASPLTKLAETHVWFRTPPQTAPPLGDRLETVILRHLTATPRWEHEALLAAIYQQFCDHLSPEPELTEAIIQAYTMPDAQGLLILRPEDEPGSRRREQRQLERDLRSLGDRLGYSSARHLGGDLVWREGGTVPYLFRVTSSATLAEHLLNPPPRCDGRRCLVVPGGRAALIALKLRRDPRLAARAADQHWIFIKFRHLRRMIAEMTDRAEIEVFLGLDPIVEQQGAQIPLPIQLKRAGE
jgi:hypothetical protein